MMKKPTKLHGCWRALPQTRICKRLLNAMDWINHHHEPDLHYPSLIVAIFSIQSYNGNLSQSQSCCIQHNRRLYAIGGRLRGSDADTFYCPKCSSNSGKNDSQTDHHDPGCLHLAASIKQRLQDHPGLHNSIEPRKRIVLCHAIIGYCAKNLHPKVCDCCHNLFFQGHDKKLSQN